MSGSVPMFGAVLSMVPADPGCVVEFRCDGELVVSHELIGYGVVVSDVEKRDGVQYVDSQVQPVVLQDGRPCVVQWLDVVQDVKGVRWSIVSAEVKA